MGQGFDLFFQTTESLQYFNGSITFTSGTKTMAATGIETGWTVGDEFVMSGTANNNGTFTIATLGTNTLTVAEAVVSEGPVGGTMNQQVSSGWKRSDFYSRLVGIYGTSGNASLRTDWSVNRVTALVTLSTAITGGSPAAYAQEVIAPWVNVRLRNNGADQTSVACHIYAKAEI